MINVLNINQPLASDLELAAMLKALGDPTRLRIFRCLLSCCASAEFAADGSVAPLTGPTAGEVCCRVTGQSQITPLISHHLKELRVAGLITMERRGKNMICAVKPGAIEQLAVLFRPSGGTNGASSETCC